MKIWKKYIKEKKKQKAKSNNNNKKKRTKKKNARQTRITWRKQNCKKYGQ